MHAIADLPRPDSSGNPGHDSLVVCPWFRVGDTVVRTVLLAARFDTPIEVTLDELRIELVYPLDAAAEQFFRHFADTTTR